MYLPLIISMTIILFSRCGSSLGVNVEYIPKGMYSNVLVNMEEHSLCNINVVIPKSHTFYTWNIETGCRFNAVGDGGLGDPIQSITELDRNAYPNKEVNFTCLKGHNSIKLPMAERYNFTTDPQEIIKSVVKIDSFCDGHEEHNIIELEDIEPIRNYIPPVGTTLFSTALLVGFGTVFIIYITFIRKTL